jgi:aldose 1-epimerase
MKILSLLFFAAFATSAVSAELPKAEPFGQAPDGTPVVIYTLTNKSGAKLRAMNYGAIVVSLEVPDRTGKNADIVLGFNTMADYVAHSPYFGAVVGRYGNRIAGGKFSLAGHEYTLATNNAPGGIPCSLHGGLRGFDKVVWHAEPLAERDTQGVKFTYTSKDGEEGFPGNLNASVTYWLNDRMEWRIQYEATSDKPTPVNLTQHTYFNLKGEGGGDVLDHELTIAAAKFLPVNVGLIPTGEIRAVKGTPFDFTTAHRIGERIDAHDEQIQFGGGYDLNWVLDNQGGLLARAATVYEPTTGRVMEVLTTEPGVQFYSANHLDGKLTGPSGRPYNARNAFCLETQHYPDSPNQPSFPSAILHPGETMRSTTVFHFSSK